LPESTPIGASRDERFDDACQLWAGRFQAIIATHSLADPGYPFASAVPYCLDPCGNPLLLLSHLAQHTKNLGADARCGLSVVQTTDSDLQQSLRLGCTADCQEVSPADAASQRRWFRYYPLSRRYFEQLNFRLYRLTPRRFHLNGGFGTARWLDSTRILRVSPFDEAQELDLIQAAQGVSDAVWPDPADRPTSEPIRIVGVDPWGVDLARGHALRRVPLPEPITDLDHLRVAFLARTGG
jgi:heme iron utilization protein